MKLDFVKLFNRYNFFYISNKGKIYFLFSNNNITNIKKKLSNILKKKKKKNGYIIITSLNIVSKKLYLQNKKSKIKVLGGPIYIKLLKYERCGEAKFFCQSLS